MPLSTPATPKYQKQSSKKGEDTKNNKTFPNVLGRAAKDRIPSDTTRNVWPPEEHNTFPQGILDSGRYAGTFLKVS